MFHKALALITGKARILSILANAHIYDDPTGIQCHHFYIAGRKTPCRGIGSTDWAFLQERGICLEPQQAQAPQEARLGFGGTASQDLRCPRPYAILGV